MLQKKKNTILLLKEYILYFGKEQDIKVHPVFLLPSDPLRHTVCLKLSLPLAKLREV